ncbi:hypothetical protein ACTXT7_003255 [Hymenolepis weldensis]
MYGRYKAYKWAYSDCVVLTGQAEVQAGKMIDHLQPRDRLPAFLRTIYETSYLLTVAAPQAPGMRSREKTFAKLDTFPLSLTLYKLLSLL